MNVPGQLRDTLKVLGSRPRWSTTPHEIPAPPEVFSHSSCVDITLVHHNGRNTYKAKSDSFSTLLVDQSSSAD